VDATSGTALETRGPAVRAGGMVAMFNHIYNRIEVGPPPVHGRLKRPPLSRASPRLRHWSVGRIPLCFVERSS